MTPSTNLKSASGLRPMSAFVVIAAVVLAVVVKVGGMALAGTRKALPEARVEEGWQPAYAIEDREGRPLARFVTRLDLIVSPRSMWRGHTPDHMALAISDALGGSPTPDELLALLFPDAVDGVIRVDAWHLAPAEAQAVADWIEGRGADADDEPGDRVPGCWLEPVPDEPQRWLLAWEPVVALSRETRRAGGVSSPVRWTRRLADGLAAALPGRVARPVTEGEESPQESDERRRTRERDAVWRALIPCAWRVAIEDVPPEIEAGLSALLEREGVQDHQMKIEEVRERNYPLGTFDLLGDWGFVDESSVEPVPRGGLELLGDRTWQCLLERGVVPRAAHYAYRVNRPVGRGRERRSYFLNATDPDEAPIVRVTLDHGLQQQVRRQLELVLEKHEPVLAMAIVVEVESGKVLAVDGVHAADFPGFQPTWFRFTPGSTFKVVTMATALEAGVVRPEERLDVGHGPWRVPGSSNWIEEAEGTVDGWLTAAECIAHSSNRGMAQIGLRIAPETFHAKAVALGYGRSMDAGFTRTTPGSLMSLENWNVKYDQAALSFGHAVSTTLWQHAAALSAILRGGRFLPLRLLESVHVNGRWIPVPPPAPTRVFREDVCADVRDMMRLGARVGTGRKFWRPDIDMGTKTGTAQKVAAELCTHVETQATRELGRAPRAAERAQLRKLEPPHQGGCYTSSMCVFGSTAPDLPGGVGGRELMVLVVVEEPTKGGKFGAQVAGPAAMAILEEALGLTRQGHAPVPAVLGEFAPLAPETLEAAAPLLGELGERPWAETGPRSSHAGASARGAWGQTGGASGGVRF